MTRVRPAAAIVASLALAACARGQIGGQLRHDLGTPAGIAAASASLGAAEAVWRFDLQALHWTFGTPAPAP